MNQQERGYWQGDQPDDNTNQAAKAELGAAAIYSTDDDSQAASAKTHLQWEALEYTHHDKNLLWFLVFGAVAIVIIGVSIFLKAWTFMVLAVVMAVAFVVFALRPPRHLHYEISSQGIKIEHAIYPFSDFKSFSVITDGQDYYIVLIPTRRIMLGVNLYFEQKDGEQIVDTLSQILPMEQLSQDPIDKIMRRLHF